MKKWPGGATGATTFYDPIEHVDEIKGHARLRIEHWCDTALGNKPKEPL